MAPPDVLSESSIPREHEVVADVAEVQAGALGAVVAFVRGLVLGGARGMSGSWSVFLFVFVFFLGGRFK